MKSIYPEVEGPELDYPSSVPQVAVLVRVTGYRKRPAISRASRAASGSPRRTAATPSWDGHPGAAGGRRSRSTQGRGRFQGGVNIPQSAVYMDVLHDNTVRDMKGT